MANVEYLFDEVIDLANPSTVRYPADTIYYGDSYANKVKITLKKNGQAITQPAGAQCNGRVVQPDGNKELPFNGTVTPSTGVMEMTQPPEAYSAEGMVTISMQYEYTDPQTNVKTLVTVICLKVNVAHTQGSVIVEPVEIGANINDLLAHLDDVMNVYNNGTKVVPKSGVTGTEIATVTNIKTGATSKIYAPNATATTSANGLMSAADKTKLDQINIKGPRSIAQNENLNSLIDDGFYVSGQNAISETLSNCPTMNAFCMEVHRTSEAAASSEYGCEQTIVTYPLSDNRQYKRRMYGSNWSAWEEYVPAGLVIQSGTNLNTIRTQGLYYTKWDSVGALTNAPENSPFAMHVFSTGNSVLKPCIQVIEMFGGTDNALVHYVRVFNGVIWTEWTKYQHGGSGNIDHATTSTWGTTKLTTSSWEESDETTSLTPKSLGQFSYLVVTGAHQFSTSQTYQVGSFVRYDTNVWRCHTAVTTPGEWTGTNNWTALHTLQNQIEELKDRYGVCNTQATTQIKQVDIPGVGSTQYNGLMIVVHFSTDQGYNGQPKLKLNTMAASYPIWRTFNTQAGLNDWGVGEDIPLVYYSGNWYMIGKNPATTSYYGVTKLDDDPESTSATTSLTPHAFNLFAKNTVIGNIQEYRSDLPYSVGNKVRQDGAVYKCNTAIPARGEEWNPNHWTKVDSLQAQIDSIASGGGGTSIPYGTCDSNEYGQIKDVTISGVTQLTDGMMIRVHFSTPQSYEGQPTLRLNSNSATDAPITFSSNVDADKGAWEAGDELLLAYHRYTAALHAWEIVGHGPASISAYGLMSPDDKKKLDTLEHGSQNIMLDWLEPEIDDEWGANCTITRNVKMAIGNLDDVSDTKYVYNATRVQHSKSTAYNSDKIVFTIGGQGWNMVNYMETGENGKKYVFSVWVKNNHATNSLEIMNGLNNALSTPIEPGETRLYSRVETASTSDPGHPPFLRFDFIAPAGTDGIDVTFFQPSITEGLYKTENVLNLSTATEHASGYMSKADKAMLNILSGMDEHDFVDFRNTSTFTNSSAGKLRICGYVANLNFVGHLAVSMSAGVSVTGGTLPVYSRPAENITFTCCTNEASGPKVIRCNINTSGVITLISSAAVSSGTAILANTSWIVPKQ